MAAAMFDFRKIADESKNVLLHPGDYFTAMAKEEGGLPESFVKALVYGVIGGIIALFGSVSGITGGGVLGELFGFRGIHLFIWSVVASILGLGVGSCVMILLSIICSGKRSFRTAFLVSASLLILAPIMSIVTFTGYISLYLGNALTLALCLYTIFLMYIGEVKALEGEEIPARIIAIILAVIPLALLLSIMLCSHAVQSGSFRPVSEYEEERKKTMEELMNSRFVKQNLEAASQGQEVRE